MMGRPRTISSTGKTMRMSTIVSEKRYRELQRLAKRNNITLGAVVRLCIDSALDSQKIKVTS